MPIRREFRHFYGRQWREEIRPRILARAGNQCETCQAPNHKTVLRTFSWWAPADLESTVFMSGGSIAGRPVESLIWTAPGNQPRRLSFPRMACMHWVGIVLTIAHLNHQPGDDRDENLKALCQYCHLRYDLEHHRETRQYRKDRSRPLLNIEDRKENAQCPAPEPAPISNY